MSPLVFVDCFFVSRYPMKTMIVLAMALVCLGCSPSAQSEQSPNSQTQITSNPNTQSLNSEQKMTTMQITIGEVPFTVELAGNATSDTLQTLLPLTLSMDDHLRNEKHAQLPKPLPTDSHTPRQIQAGDVMLWGDDTLVIFYESFTSSYSYTRIGKISDVSQLKSAVGRGTVQVQFSNQ